ncbi:CBS domain-containing protein [Kineosporia succinea]|uniref:CBS domain-containing protein n=1 Tax=Kineosporia succinea TaxID=84632 RepID=A0ABT9PF62_9ACTN|nr:CBS domain-containing protein [Kineosporia succinea]MDP9831121.1 CBS domain-containing protein [Kineosporia succinea]
MRPLRGWRVRETLLCIMNEHLTTRRSLTGTVGDLVVRHPKTLPAGITVGQARAAFGDHVHMLLLTEHGVLRGTLVREDLTGDAGSPALDRARLEGRTIPADVPADQARELLVRRGARRLAVVDDTGHLLGLLCLKRRLHGFCSDADVEARAADPHRTP